MILISDYKIFCILVVTKPLKKSIINMKPIKEEYKGSKIVAWQVDKKHIVCHLYRKGSNNQPLNLGECHDGKPFQSVKHAVNQAKDLINYYELKS